MEPTFYLSGTKHWFNPLGGPIDEPERSQFFSDFGYAMSAWARMEYMLTCLAIHINKQSTCALLHEPDPQAKFKGLLKLLRKWITRHPGYKHLTSPMDKVFFEGLLEEADLRNELTHGFLKSIDPETGDFVMLQAKRIAADTWKMSTVRYNAKALSYLAIRSNLAHRHFVELAKALFEKTEVPPAQSQMP